MVGEAFLIPMATFTITLDSGESFPCPDDTYILDADAEQGFAVLCISYPLSDRTISASAEEDLVLRARKELTPGCRAAHPSLGGCRL